MYKTTNTLIKSQYPLQNKKEYQINKKVTRQMINSIYRDKPFYHVFGHSSMTSAVKNNGTFDMYQIPENTIVFFRRSPGKLCTQKLAPSNRSSNNSNSNNNSGNYEGQNAFFEILETHPRKLLNILTGPNTSLRKKGQIYYPNDYVPNVSLTFEDSKLNLGIFKFNSEAKSKIRNLTQNSNTIKLSQIVRNRPGIYIFTACRGGFSNNQKTQYHPSIIYSVNQLINQEIQKKKQTNQLNRLQRFSNVNSATIERNITFPVYNQSIITYNNNESPNSMYENVISNFTGHKTSLQSKTRLSKNKISTALKPKTRPLKSKTKCKSCAFSKKKK